MDLAKRQLEEFVRRWYEEFPKGDVAEMANFYTDDARLFLTGLKGVNGKQAIGELIATMPKHLEMKCEHKVTDVDMLSDDLAVVTGIGWVESVPRAGGDTIFDASRFIMVMKRDAQTGEWRSHYDISQHTPDASFDDRPGQSDQ